MAEHTTVRPSCSILFILSKISDFVHRPAIA